SAGSPPRGSAHWPAIVAERRAAIEAWTRHETPPALGPVPEGIDDPAIVMLWGITRESLDAWLTAESGGDPHQLMGWAAPSGVVDGVERVVKSVGGLARRRDGVIRVRQVTNPRWPPSLRALSCAVGGGGGPARPAAIVVRESGLAAGVGTGTATGR